MLIEHRFVSTVAWPELTVVLAEALPIFGLSLSSACASCSSPPVKDLIDLQECCPLCSRRRKLLFSNNAGAPRETVSAAEHPLSLLLEFERGLVNLAATIRTPRKPTSEHEAVLSCIARSLEAVICKKKPVSFLENRWAEVSAAAEQTSRKHRSRNLVHLLILGIVCLVALGVVVNAVVQG